MIQLDLKTAQCKIDGIVYPMVGFGTWPSTGDTCKKAVIEAIQAGYRMIDTATLYKNFGPIAKALAGQDRSEFYLISKVWHDQHLPDDLTRDLETTLAELKIDYLDAYLLHWPNSAIPIEKTFGAMEALKRKGKIRHVGLSNVTVNHLKKALKVGVPITWVQVEMHPDFCDFNLLVFCKRHSIHLQAWHPLSKGALKDDGMLAEIGKKYKKSACQVALRWILQHGCFPLPGSKSREHIQENFDVADFSLSHEEMDEIDKRASKGTRFRASKEIGMGFDDEFDFTYEECWPSHSIS